MKGRGSDPFKVKIERGWIVLGVALTLLKSVHVIFCGGLKLTTLLGCEIMIVAVEFLETMVKGVGLRRCWERRERLQAIELHCEDVGGEELRGADDDSEERSDDDVSLAPCIKNTLN